MTKSGIRIFRMMMNSSEEKKRGPNRVRTKQVKRWGEIQQRFLRLIESNNGLDLETMGVYDEYMSFSLIN